MVAQKGPTYDMKRLFIQRGNSGDTHTHIQTVGGLCIVGESSYRGGKKIQRKSFKKVFDTYTQVKLFLCVSFSILTYFLMCVCVCASMHVHASLVMCESTLMFFPCSLTHFLHSFYITLQ